MLNLVVDNSGSLIEGGKRFIARTVLRQLRDFWLAMNPTGTIRLFLMTDKGLQEVAWTQDQDVPCEVLSPRGRARINDVVSHLWSEDDGVVLISDYCMLPEDRRMLRTWIEQMGVRRARLVVVGDVLSVDQTEQGLFSAEQVDGVLDGFLGETT